MLFEWDNNKEQKNLMKHGVDFRTAARVFEDPDRIERYDEAHSLEEDRFVTIGNVRGVFIILTVVYTERSDAIRLISARKANKKEEEIYRYVNQNRY